MVWGTCRRRAGLTWSASAMGTNVGCVMRGGTLSQSGSSAKQRHDGQRDARRAGGVVEDVLVGDAVGGARRERLAGPGVADEERMGAARDLEADPVTL